MASVPRPVVKPRPVYLNLLQIRQPLPAIVSILHRASGAALFFVGLPLALWTLQTSLGSPEGYQRVASFFGHPVAKLVLIGLVWSYVHHLIAGVRHLLADIHIGLELASARQSAAVTLVLGILLTLAIAVKLW